MADIRKFKCIIPYIYVKAHSCVERACLLGAVKCRSVETDEFDRMTGQALAAAIQQDKENGLIPFFVSHPFYVLFPFSNYAYYVRMMKALV